MSSTLPIDNKFGNYSVHGIEEITLAAPVSWAPATPAWNVLGAALLLFAAYALYRRYQYWKANAYRRKALQRIAELKLAHNNTPVPSALLHELPTLMKAAALHAFPRNPTAALTGEPWLKFLDNSYNGPRFQSDTGRSLLQLAYLDETGWTVDQQTAQLLIAQCERWLAEHRAGADYA